MKKLFMYLSLLVMPFALAGNKESVKEVKAEVDTNATITIGENTFSRVTTSNMNKVKDGAKVILATENPTNGLVFATNDFGNKASYITRGYSKSKLVDSSNNIISNAPEFVFDVTKVVDSFELSISNSKLLVKNSSNNKSVYFDKDNKLFTDAQYYSDFTLTTKYYGNDADFPIFTRNNNTIYSLAGGYSFNKNGYGDLYFTSDTSYKTKANYGTPCIYVLDEASELTNEEKATAFVNKWKVYDDNFCGNLKDETKRTEMSALIAEYDALDLEVKALVDAAIIKDGVTVANQIEYVRNSLAITKSENTSQSLVNIITTNNSTMTFVLILSITTISLISYAFVLKTKKNK